MNQWINRENKEGMEAGKHRKKISLSENPLESSDPGLYLFQQNA